MENVPIKLNQLEPEFHYFEDNQVLTAGQLNQVVDYFDRQARLSRTRLMGTGIVCGLEVRLDNNGHIRLSKGTAITTDGDLLHIDQDLILTQFVPFDDTKAAYPAFWRGEPAAQIDLFRLYTDQAEASQIEGLKDIDDIGVDMNDLAVMLYLNSYLEPPEECTEVGCENRGPRQRQGLMVMLVRKNDVDRFASASGSQFLNLPDVVVQRVALTHAPENPELSGANIDSRADLLGRFKSAIDGSKGTLIETLLRTCGDLESEDWLYQLIQPAYSGTTPAVAWRQRLEAIFGVSENQLGIQYVHNFMKDLEAAYDEFRACVQDLYVECCPDPQYYPKHMMVQEVTAQPNPFGWSRYRYYFAENPILNNADRRVQKARFLHRRIHEMINAFDIPARSNNSDAIEITPVRRDQQPLSTQPIPYYYNFNSGALLRQWNFEKTRKGQFSSVLGYHNRSFNGAPKAREPFRYTGLDYNFFRIEGHIGLPLDTVEKKLEELRERHNIGFKIEKVLIEKNIGLVRIPGRIKYPGVRYLLDSYREDLLDHITSVRDYSSAIRATPINQSLFAGNETMATNLSEAVGKSAELDNRLNTMEEQIGGNLKTFEARLPQFEQTYTAALALGHDIKAKTYYATQTQNDTPLQNFVLSNKYYKFRRLFDFKKQKEEKVREQLIFERFLEDHPGLEHLGGVHEGGTLVLAYTVSGNTATVIGDFCLPYVGTIDEDPEVDYQRPSNGTYKPPVHVLQASPTTFNWIEKYDVFKVPAFRASFDKVKAIEVDFGQKATSFYRDVVTTVINRAPAEGGDGTVTGDLAGQLRDMMNERFGEFRVSYDNRLDNLTKDLTSTKDDLVKRVSNVDSKLNQQRNDYSNKINRVEGSLNNAKAKYDGKIATYDSKMKVYDAKVATYDGKIATYDSKIKSYDTKIKGYDQKLTVYDSKMNVYDSKLNIRVLDNPVIDVRGGGGRFRPGGPGPVLGDSGDMTALTRTMLTNNLMSTAEVIRKLSEKENRTSAEEAQLKELTKLFESTTLTVLESFEPQTDIAPDSAEAAVLEAIALEKSSLGEEGKMRRVSTKVNKLLEAHRDKPGFAAILNRIKG